MPNVTLAKMPQVEVGNANSQNAVVIKVDKPHGDLEISTGGVKWTPRGESGKRLTKQSRQVFWKALVEVLNEKGRKG